MNTSLSAPSHRMFQATGRWHAALCIGLLAAAVAGPVNAQPSGGSCGPLQNGYGPYDYRVDRDKLPIVENAHFTPEVEALIRAVTGYIGGDLDYTLRAFPNHHRALIAMMRYGERTKSAVPPSAKYSVECYFERALRFKPDDTVARMLFATYLHKNKRDPEASQQLERTLALAGDNGFTHYNAGLVYMDLKNYDKALEQAHLAHSLGFGRPELSRALKAAGRWVEPPAQAASAPEAESASASASAPSAGQSGGREAAPVEAQAR